MQRKSCSIARDQWILLLGQRLLFLTCPTSEVFCGKFKLEKDRVLRLVEMTCGLVHASYSLPKCQAVKLTERQYGLHHIRQNIVSPLIWQQCSPKCTLFCLSMWETGSKSSQSSFTVACCTNKKHWFPLINSQHSGSPCKWTVSHPRDLKKVSITGVATHGKVKIQSLYGSREKIKMRLCESRHQYSCLHMKLFSRRASTVPSCLNVFTVANVFVYSLDKTVVFLHLCPKGFVC